MTVLARKVVPSCMCDVIGRTGPLIRLAARGKVDLFASPLVELGIAVGDVVLLRGQHEDGEETVSAEVIALPRAGIVELRQRAELERGTKVVTIRKSRMA